MQRNFPDREGHFGILGGKYVPETLMAPLIQLEKTCRAAKKDPTFQKELNFYLRDWGRPQACLLQRKQKSGVCDGHGRGGS